MGAIVAVIGVLSAATFVIAFFGLIFRLIFRRGPTIRRWGAIFGSSFVLMTICIALTPHKPQTQEQAQDIGQSVSGLAEQPPHLESASQDIYVTLDVVDDAFEEVPVNVTTEVPQKTIAETIFVPVRIVKVLDAATFDAEIDGKPEKIRLDYLDIPELRKEKPDFYSREAAEFVKDKIENREVYIDKEPYIRDKFDRIVTSIWIDLPSNEKNPTDEDISTKMLNAVLLAEGCARIFESNHMSLLVDWDLFKGLQSDAQKAQKGIWKQQASTVARKEISLVGNRNSRILHEPSCSSVGRMKSSNIVMMTYADAIDRGYKPCQRCYPTGPVY